MDAAGDGGVKAEVGAAENMEVRFAADALAAAVVGAGGCSRGSGLLTPFRSSSAEFRALAVALAMMDSADVGSSDDREVCRESGLE